MSRSIGRRAHLPGGSAAVLVAAATAAVGLTACSGGTAHDHASARVAASNAGDQLVRHDARNDRYGPLPSWLPKNSVRNNAPLVAGAGDPAITSEGDLVTATVGRAHVSATVSGPVVPGEGLPEPPGATTCTWTVTMRTTGGSLPLRAADFNALDHLGTIYRVAAVPDQPAIPAAVRPGHPVTFELRAVMPTGEGVMRWSPNRRTILAEWDFTVEND